MYAASRAQRAAPRQRFRYAFCVSAQFTQPHLKLHRVSAADRLPELQTDTPPTEHLSHSAFDNTCSRRAATDSPTCGHLFKLSCFCPSRPRNLRRRAIPGLLSPQLQPHRPLALGFADPRRPVFTRTAHTTHLFSPRPRQSDRDPYTTLTCRMALSAPAAS